MARTIATGRVLAIAPNYVSSSIDATGTQLSLVFDAAVTPVNYTVPLVVGTDNVAATYASGTGTSTLVYNISSSPILDDAAVTVSVPWNTVANAGGIGNIAVSGQTVTNNSTFVAFTMLVDTTKGGSASNVFVLPTAGSGTYNYTVYWGDTTSEAVVVNTSQTHTYSVPGVYSVKITGTFPRIYFNNAGDRLKLIRVDSLGSVAFTSFFGAFYGCSNLTTFIAGPNANTVGNTSCQNMFLSCSSLATCDFTNFNTAAVTSMRSMLNSCIVFNQPVSNFNTAAVQSMNQMFFGCTVFNQDVSGWNIGALTDATNMLLSSGFTQTNYDLLLPAWQGQAHQLNVTFSAGSAKYGAGAPATARAALVTDGWAITDGGAA